MGMYSPIISVAPVLANGSIGTPVYDLPDVSAYAYQLADISAPSAGRTEDQTMHKKRIGQAIKINLEWKALKTADVSKVLKAFNPQYVQIKYLDAYEGMDMTTIFYVGDRATPLYNATKGLWENVTFGIIQRVPKKITF